MNKQDTWGICLVVMFLGFTASVILFVANNDGNIFHQVLAALFGIASCVCPVAVTLAILQLTSTEEK